MQETVPRFCILVQCPGWIAIVPSFNHAFNLEIDSSQAVIDSYPVTPMTRLARVRIANPRSSLFGPRLGRHGTAIGHELTAAGSSVPGTVPGKGWL